VWITRGSGEKTGENELVSRQPRQPWWPGGNMGKPPLRGNGDFRIRNGGCWTKISWNQLDTWALGNINIYIYQMLTIANPPKPWFGWRSLDLSRSKPGGGKNCVNKWRSLWMNLSIYIYVCIIIYIYYIIIHIYNYTYIYIIFYIIITIYIIIHIYIYPEQIDVLL
jgi:hypothetical protein